MSQAVKSVFHTGFVVSDLDASLRFYCDGLGMVLRHRQVQHNPYTAALVGYEDADIEVAQLKFAEGEPPFSGHVLELIAYKKPPSGPVDLERSTLGAGHLAFVVDDIFGMAANLERLGARFLNPPVRITEGINAGGWAAYFFDPDGVTLELLQPRRAEQSEGKDA
jgi:catechol 2,3-dioxygenase-like lactoylglutathione lyase family enzyme